MVRVVIDIGNSSYKLGFFQDNELRPFEQATVGSPDQVRDLLRTHPFHKLLLSSVSPKRQRRLEDMLRTFFPRAQETCCVLHHKQRIPLRMRYPREELGADRVASAVGSRVLFPRKNCLIVDVGTCITYNLVDKHDHYWGGGIVPGVRMRFRALSAFTEALPSVEPDHNNWHDTMPLTTSSTRESMICGVVGGIFAELHGIVRRYHARYDDLLTVFCGGDALFFAQRMPLATAEPALGLIGLNNILRAIS